MSIQVPLGQIDYKIAVVAMENGSAVNIASASMKKIKVVKPSREEIFQAATFETNGSDGDMYYKTVLNDLDELGWYTFRGYYEIGNFKGYTLPGKFLVVPV